LLGPVTPLSRRCVADRAGQETRDGLREVTAVAVCELGPTIDRVGALEASGRLAQSSDQTS
jgi:hypothetical protein